MRIVAVMAMALILVTGSGASARLRDHTHEAALQRACEAEGHGAEPCSCVAREANSRFSHDNLDILGHTVPDLARITDDPALARDVPVLGQMSAAERDQLRQRAEIADVVIRQACGIGLRLGHGRPARNR